MLIRPCLGCGNVPCDGTHIRCDLLIYAEHRGLTVQQVVQQQRFEERRTSVFAERAIRAWLERDRAPQVWHSRPYSNVFVSDDDPQGTK